MRDQLSNLYKPLFRYIAILNETVDGLYKDGLVNYFKENGIFFDKLVQHCMKVEHDISKVERILLGLNGRLVSRNEPGLVVGGGFMADVDGFARALYHRNTPHATPCT